MHKDHIYLAGGTKDEGNPIIIVFDTLGNLINHQTFLPDKPELWYGYITDMRFDSDQNVLIATASVAPACDVGGPSIFSWRINDNLEKIDEFEFSIPNVANLIDPNVRHSDTLIAITVEGAAANYDQQNNIYQQVALPNTLSDPTVIVHQNNLVVFDDYQKKSLVRLDMDGNILASMI